MQQCNVNVQYCTATVHAGVYPQGVYMAQITILCTGSVAECRYHFATHQVW